MKLSPYQRNRIDEYITYFQNRDIIETFEIEIMKTILKDGKYTSVHKKLLNTIECKYQCYICDYWEDDDGSYVYGKDVFNKLINKQYE
jgi:hypothetical protein